MSSPFVYWGQKVDSITLRIEAKCGRTQPPEVKVTDQDVRFRAIVQDGDESSEYSFRLRLFDQILCNVSDNLVSNSDENGPKLI